MAPAHATVRNTVVLPPRQQGGLLVVVRPQGWLLLAVFSWAWGERKTWARPDQGLGSQGTGGEAPRKPHSFPRSPWPLSRSSVRRDNGDPPFLLEGHTV